MDGWARWCPAFLLPAVGTLLANGEKNPRLLPGGGRENERPGGSP